jgi:fermentation-respiration switch protein FrsA (DUF1100 family)
MNEDSANSYSQSGRKSNLLVRVIFWILVAAAALALIAWLVVGAMAADRLTVPKRVFDENRTPMSYGMDYENVDFTSRDGKTSLKGWYIPSASSERAIVFVHGRNASRTAAYGDDADEAGVQSVPGRLLEFTSELHKADFSVFLFDLRGHGQSADGRFSFGQKERLDALAAVDWLNDHGYQPGNIGMMGLSLGAAASIGAAAEDSSIGVLVVDSSFADLSQMVDSSWTRESGLPMIFVTSTRWMIRLMYGWDLNDIKPVKEITQVPPRPVMIIACQDDQSVTVNQFEQLKAAVPSAQTWLLPHCIHGQTYNQDPALFEQKVIGFFEASLR